MVTFMMQYHMVLQVVVTPRVTVGFIVVPAPTETVKGQP